jgi:hypothetical protein
MNLTFGIVTDHRYPDRLREIFQSIRALQVPNYEILVVGGAIEDRFTDPDVRYVPFNEHAKPMWVTRKKNLLDQECQYENLVVMHDYYVFQPDWYTNFLEFGSDWEVCSTTQLLIGGKRHFTDWVVWDSPIYPRYYSLPYDDWTHTKHMYQSGGYMLVKKGVLERFPMNEAKSWGNAEDVEWSLQMRDHLLWKCNGKSVVKHNKYHRDEGNNQFPLPFVDKTATPPPPSEFIVYDTMPTKVLTYNTQRGGMQQ